MTIKWVKMDLAIQIKSEIFVLFNNNHKHYNHEKTGILSFRFANVGGSLPR